MRAKEEIVNDFDKLMSMAYECSSLCSDPCTKLSYAKTCKRYVPYGEFIINDFVYHQVFGEKKRPQKTGGKVSTFLQQCYAKIKVLVARIL